MNNSVNYSGFIDLAIDTSSIDSSTSSYQTSENCKPALAVQLYDDNELQQLMQGVSLHNPVKSL